jgi:four helix bundle protein
MNSYRDLRVWQLGMDISKQVYRLTVNFPKSEQFGLTSQAQRAAVSIPANIAEGHARDSTKEYQYHLSVARGSLAELETLMTLAHEFGYLLPVQYDALLAELEEMSRTLRGLQKALRRKLAESNTLSPKRPQLRTNRYTDPHPSPLDPCP